MRKSGIPERFFQEIPFKIIKVFLQIRREENTENKNVLCVNYLRFIIHADR